MTMQPIDIASMDEVDFDLEIYRDWPELDPGFDGYEERYDEGYENGFRDAWPPYQQFISGSP